MVAAPVNYLESIPLEMLVEIVRKLDFYSVQNLLCTNKYLYNRILGNRHLFEKINIDLSIYVHEDKSDILRILIRKYEPRIWQEKEAVENRRHPSKQNPVRRMAEFRMSDYHPCSSLKDFPLGTWPKYKSVGKTKEQLVVKSFENVIAFYLPRLFLTCNPCVLNVYQCSNAIIQQLAHLMEDYKCKVNSIDLNCGSACSSQNVANLMNTIVPERIVFRAQYSSDGTAKVFNTRAFRNADELDVVVFHSPRHMQNPVPVECVMPLRGRYVYTNIPVQVTNGLVRTLVESFVRFERDFDHGLGWSLPCRTGDLDAAVIFDGEKVMRRTVRDHLQRPCGHFYEISRGPLDGDKLRVMWNANTLLINGILFTLRHHTEFV